MRISSYTILFTGSGKRQSVNRNKSMSMLLTSLSKLESNENGAWDIKTNELIALLKGHINATNADHQAGCCFTFFKWFTRSNLSNAYEKALGVAPKNHVERIAAKEIDFDEREGSGRPMTQLDLRLMR